MRVVEVAEELGIDERTVRYWITTGILLGPCFKRKNFFYGDQNRSRVVYLVSRRDFDSFRKFYKGKVNL